MGYPSNPAISDSAAPGQDGNGLRGARESDEVTLAYFDVTQTFPEGIFHLFGTATGFFTPGS